MKKILNKISATIILVVIVLTGITVNAEDNITVIKKTNIPVGNELTGERNESKYLTDSGYAFCITPKKIGVSKDTVLSHKETINDGGLLYLLRNVTDNDENYIITQLALWEYYSNYLPDFYNKYSDLSIVGHAKALANQASLHKDDNDTYPSIELILDEQSEIQDLDNNFVSRRIIVRANGIDTAKVKLINAPKNSSLSTSFIDEIKDEVTSTLSVSDGDVFTVVIPKSSVKTNSVSFDVEATASTKVATIERYTPNNEFQDLVLLKNKEITASTKIGITFIKEENIEEKNICSLVNGIYYDKNGNETNQETFLSECEVHKCEKINGKYFGKNGNIVEENEFEKQCYKHVCEKIDNIYFDAFGKEVNYNDYRTQCEIMVCEIVNGKYFGVYGKEVSRSEFINQCDAQIVPVPDTKTSAIISTTIGVIMLIIASKVVTKYNKNND